MKMKNKCAAVSLEKSRLLAAMAILAVAFVVLAAVPVAMTDSDAARGTSDPVTGVTEITKDSSDSVLTLTTTGNYYISGDLSAKAITIPANPSGLTLYFAENAKIGIKTAGSTGGSTTVYIAKEKTNSGVTYYTDSGATLTSTSDAQSSALAFVVKSGVMSLGKETKLTLAMNSGVTVAYDDVTIGYPSGVAGTSLKLTVGTSATGAEPAAGTAIASSVVFNIITLANGTSYTVTVSDDDTSTTDSAEFTGPFVGTSGTIAVTNNSGLKITSSTAVSTGNVKRISNDLTFANTNISTTLMENGQYVSGTNKLTAPTGTSTDNGTLALVKGTEVTANDGIALKSTDGNTTFATLKKGFKTTVDFNITASSTSQLAITSTAKWSGDLETSASATVLKLGVANGNITVGASSAVVQSSGANGNVLYGNLKIGAGAKLTVDYSIIVAETGSIEITTATTGSEDARVNFIQIADGKYLDVLGTVSGKGSIGLASSANAQTSGVRTADGTKKAITCADSPMPTQAVHSVTTNGTSNTGTTSIDSMAYGYGLGYQAFKLGATFVVPYASNGYEFPTGVQIDAGAGVIYVVGNTDTSKKAMQVTVPAGTTIDLGSVATTQRIILGAAYGDASWDTQDAYVTLNVEGKITGKGTIYSADSKATLNLGANGTIGSDVAVTVPNVTGEKKELHLNGNTTQSIIYPVYQKIYVDEGATWTITDGNVVEIDGELEVNGSIVIKDGGKLVLGKAGTAAAKASIVGDIVMEEGSKLDIINAEMTVSGQFDMNGTVTPTKGKIDVKGIMTVGSTGVLGGATYANFQYKVASAGVLTINGYLGAVSIDNSGSVVIDNGGLEARDDEAGSVTTVYMVASGAQLTVESYLIEGASESLVVSDAGLSIGKVLTSDSSARKVGTTGPAANKVTIGATKLAKMTGELVFTESLTSATANSVKTYTNVLQITGSISNSTAAVSNVVEPVKVEIAQTGGAAAPSSSYAYETYVSVPADGELTVAKDVPVTVSGAFQVLGEVDMTATQTSGVYYLSNTGEITMEGRVKINNQAIQTSGSGVLNAAQYQTKEGSPAVTYYVYSSLEAAVEDILDESNTNTDKAVTIYGNIVVKDSMTIESPIAVKFASSSSDSSTLTVSETGTNDVVLTVEDGAKITSGRNQVIVNGTLVFEDKATGDKTTKTICDVTITSDDAEDIVYTNIYTALGTATSGATVNVTREKIASTDVVELYSSITVGEGVTLVVGDSVAPLYLKNGVTLYVNGTLQTAQDITAEKTFGTQAMNVSSGTKTSAIVVNGTLMTASAVKYGDSSSASMVAGAPIAGAYYTQGDWNVISTIAIASENQAKIASEKITVHGAIVAGDLTFAKGSNDTCKQIDVPSESVKVTGSSTATIATSLTFTSLTIDEYKLTVTGPVTGAVQNDSAAVELTSVAGSGLTIADASGKLTLTGAMDLSTSGSSAKVTKGTVNAGASTSFSTTGSKGTLTVASGATLEGVSVTDIVKLSVAGTLNVASGKSVQVTDITVTGTVKVVAGTNTSAAGTFTVTGIASIGTSTSGIRSTSASASVAGPVTYGTVVVIASGASLDEDAMSGLSSMISTEFYVEDALWITVYAPSTNSEKISYYSNSSIENALFDGWVNSSGTAVGDKTIGASGYKQVYASIEYDVFHIILKADEGVDNVSITSGSTVTKLGKGMVYDQSTGIYYNAFTATVKAGTYTVSYTLKNGYGGTATLSGDGVSGMTFKAAGTPTSDKGIDISLQLSGIEKSGYVDPVEPQKEDNSLKVTDYLLIVLVILVVVLAVIVAMRLMRS